MTEALDSVCSTSKLFSLLTQLPLTELKTNIQKKRLLLGFRKYLCASNSIIINRLTPLYHSTPYVQSETGAISNLMVTIFTSG